MTSTHSVVVGCDPGMDGAIAILVDGQVVRIHDMPTVTLERRSKGKTRKLRSIDSDQAARLIKNAAWYSPNFATPHVVIEKVMARPGEQAGGAFRFGECFGALCAVPASLGWVWTVVTPQVWKPAVGLPVGSDKGDSLDLARNLWPDTDCFERKKDHGRADAALIGLYGTPTGDGVAA